MSPVVQSSCPVHHLYTPDGEVGLQETLTGISLDIEVIQTSFIIGEDSILRVFC